jgi:type II secretory ATPase GspE/PulE/Tfp pilus assembly ATPase PilB-like protein
MSIENAQPLESATDARPDIADSLKRLEDCYRDEFSGARQATRSHLVRFLANVLETAEESAGRLFDRLQQAGLIERTYRADIERGGCSPSEHWRIATSADVQARLQEINDGELTFSPVDARQEFAAAEDLMRRAVAARATDIHLDPYDDEVEVRFRIDGRLEHYCRLNDLIAAKTIAQLKLMAELDVAEPFEPQEGHLELPLDFDEYSGRITVVPVAGGEAVAIRLLHRERLIRPLDALGFTAEQRLRINKLLADTEGIVIVSGPTGSGKTTTLYSLLHALDDGHRNIVTIEDPIEFRIPAFLQIEVDEKHNLTTARALKTVLRMDPDIVMLGELRDDVTTGLAMRAADTGSYVLGTLHARDVASVVTAMRDLHLDPRSLAANLRAVVSQRLVRRLCDECATWRPIADNEKKTFIEAGHEPPDEIRSAVGCAHCRGTGYFERVGIFEIAENTEELAQAIRDGAAESDIRDILRQSGVCSHLADGLEKVRSGITTIEEIGRFQKISASREDVATESGR